MKLKEEHIAKIDPLMEAALRQSHGDEEMIAIINIDLKNPLVKDPFEPKQFSTSEDYRRALIEYRQQEFAEGLRDTLQEIGNISLKILSGGTISRTLVVEGTAKQILQALELPGVRYAAIDQLIALPPIASAQAIERIASIYIKTLWQNESLDQRKKELVYQVAEQYIINYNAKHNKVQILGMKNPVDLESIFTSVSILSPQNIRRFRLTTDQEYFFQQSNHRTFELSDCDKISGIKIANQQQYLMVLGQPGSGKTTFLRKVGLEATRIKKDGFEHDCIPVFIELKKFKNREINLKQEIIDQFSNCKFPDAKKFVDQALEQGKLLILLDGLDEVPTSDLKSVINQIQEFTNNYQKNRFIISCRTAAYRSYFEPFTEIEIAEFDDNQIKQFIYNWFRSQEDQQAGTADNCWNLLNQPEYKSTKDLAKTPLLLTFLCLVYDNAQNFPKKRASLYSQALDILLEKWWAEKRVNLDPILREFGLEQEIIMLSEIAYQNFENYQLLYREDIIKKIKEFIASNWNAPQQLSSEEILNSIEIQQGILIERERNIYSFSHRTIQEYLTAKYIVDNDLVNRLVTKHLTDQYWKEVFLLVAGLLCGGADKLLLLMEKEAHKYLHTNVGSQKLTPLLYWADQLTNGSQGDLKLIAKRAIAIANIYTYANASAHAKTFGYHLQLAHTYKTNYDHFNIHPRLEAFVKIIVNAYANILANNYTVTNTYILSNAYAKALDNDYINALDQLISYAAGLEKQKVFKNVNFGCLIDQLKDLKAKIPQRRQPEEIHQRFAKNIIKTWLKAFYIYPNMLDLSRQELEEIDNHYFYVNWLIMQCQEAALRVSPQTWEEIERRMLRVLVNQ